MPDKLMGKKSWQAIIFFLIIMIGGCTSGGYKIQTAPEGAATNFKNAEIAEVELGLPADKIDPEIVKGLREAIAIKIEESEKRRESFEFIFSKNVIRIIPKIVGFDKGSQVARLFLSILGSGIGQSSLEVECRFVNKETKALIADASFTFQLKAGSGGGVYSAKRMNEGIAEQISKFMNDSMPCPFNENETTLLPEFRPYADAPIKLNVLSITQEKGNDVLTVAYENKSTTPAHAQMWFAMFMVKNDGVHQLKGSLKDSQRNEILAGIVHSENGGNSTEIRLRLRSENLTLPSGQVSFKGAELTSFPRAFCDSRHFIMQGSGNVQLALFEINPESDSPYQQISNVVQVHIMLNIPVLKTDTK